MTLPWEDPDVPRVLPDTSPRLPKYISAEHLYCLRGVRNARTLTVGDHYVAWGPHKGTRVSTYGCGSSTCVECYPFSYACSACMYDFPIPIPNGEVETCERCGFSYDPKTDTILEYPDPYYSGAMEY